MFKTVAVASLLTLAVWLPQKKLTDDFMQVVDLEPSGLFVGIDYDGDIVPDTGEKVQAKISELSSQFKIVTWVRLTSPGGSGNGGRALAAVLRRYPAMYVLITDRCISACALAALTAGPRRIVMGYRGVLGLHQSKDTETGEVAMEATRANARALIEAGVPERIAGNMVKTPPWDIYYLTNNDLFVTGIRGRYDRGWPNPRG